jgi:hypothetical protein
MSCAQCFCVCQAVATSIPESTRRAKEVTTITIHALSRIIKFVRVVLVIRCQLFELNQNGGVLGVSGHWFNATLSFLRTEDSVRFQELFERPNEKKFPKYLTLVGKSTCTFLFLSRHRDASRKMMLHLNGPSSFEPCVKL